MMGGKRKEGIFSLQIRQAMIFSELQSVPGLNCHYTQLI